MVGPNHNASFSTGGVMAITPDQFAGGCRLKSNSERIFFQTFIQKGYDFIIWVV